MEHPEYQYMDLAYRVLTRGFYRPSGWKPLPSQPEPPGTSSLHSEKMKFDLSEGWFPMMTLRKQWLKSTAAEMIWYLSGSTNVRDLHAMDAHVWDRWATEETAGSYGYADGELGPIYGHQWRNFGATRLADGTYADDGLDQITKLINGLRDQPLSKRHRVVGWNPADEEFCFVAPCHGDMMFQVWDDRLHMTMLQRSGDVPVGVPFNIAGYSLLLMMIAQVAGLKPGTFSHELHDPHIYEDQVDATWQLLRRRPKRYPKIRIDSSVTDIFDFRPEHFELVDYKPHPKLEIPVAT